MTGQENTRFRPFPAALWQAVVVVLLGSAIGLAFNSVRESGIPLIGSVRVVKFDTARTEEIKTVEPVVEQEAHETAVVETTAPESDPEPKPVEPPAVEPESAGPSGGVEVFSPLPAAESTEDQADHGPMALDLGQALELHEGGMAVFVDARMPDEFAAGHIPGAFNLPYDDLESHLDVLSYLPDDRMVVTYCDGSECELSLELADELMAMGFGQVRVFFGGWEQWFEAGYPSEEGEAFLP